MGAMNWLDFEGLIDEVQLGKEVDGNEPMILPVLLSRLFRGMNLRGRIPIRRVTVYNGKYRVEPFWTDRKDALTIRYILSENGIEPEDDLPLIWCKKFNFAYGVVSYGNIFDNVFNGDNRYVNCFKHIIKRHFGERAKMIWRYLCFYMIIAVATQYNMTAIDFTRIPMFLRNGKALNYLPLVDSCCGLSYQCQFTDACVGDGYTAKSYLSCRDDYLKLMEEQSSSKEPILKYIEWYETFKEWAEFTPKPNDISGSVLIKLHDLYGMFGKQRVYRDAYIFRELLSDLGFEIKYY